MSLLSLILKTARCFVLRLLYDSSSGVCYVFRVDSSFLSFREIEKGVLCVAMIGESLTDPSALESHS